MHISTYLILNGITYPLNPSDNFHMGVLKHYESNGEITAHQMEALRNSKFPYTQKQIRFLLNQPMNSGFKALHKVIVDNEETRDVDDEPVELEQSFPNKGSWTPEQLNLLFTMVTDDGERNIDKLAEALNRKPTSVYNKLSRYYDVAQRRNELIKLTPIQEEE